MFKVPSPFLPLALAAMGLIASSQAAMAGEIYKYVAEDGTVTYSWLKPSKGAYEQMEPTCLTSYIGCEMARSDWSRIPLNHSAYREQVAQVATRHGIDPALVRALIHAESNFSREARSRAGAEGLMQLMPLTQRRFGVRDPFDVEENLEAGTRLLKSLLAKYRYDIRLAAAAYNAGEEAVERYKGIPPYDETRNYVRRVALLYARYQNAAEKTRLP